MAMRLAGATHSVSMGARSAVLEALADEDPVLVLEATQAAGSLGLREAVEIRAGWDRPSIEGARARPPPWGAAAYRTTTRRAPATGPGPPIPPGRGSTGHIPRGPRPPHRTCDGAHSRRPGAPPPSPVEAPGEMERRGRTGRGPPHAEPRVLGSDHRRPGVRRTPDSRGPRPLRAALPRGAGPQRTIGSPSHPAHARRRDRDPQTGDRGYLPGVGEPASGAGAHSSTVRQNATACRGSANDSRLARMTSSDTSRPITPGLPRVRSLASVTGLPTSRRASGWASQNNSG